MAYLSSVVVLAFLAPDMLAQKAVELDYAVHLQPAFTISQAKYVHEAVLSTDPNCMVWPDVPTQRVVVRTTVPIDQSQLQLAIAPSGLHVIDVRLILPDDPQERSRMIMASVGFPLFVDTGDPDQDQNKYETAKAAWVDADPVRYDLLRRVLNGEVPPEQLR